ncbi:MAG: hypothetical protein EAX89_03635 [Candidatus Lokiarchaeota archaeon]|nr:hypothetical protein [Candidatus Lokiarchaeota archaeon]
MKMEDIDKVISLITNNKITNDNINNLISTLDVPTRNDMLKDITSQILQSNQYLSDFGTSNELILDTDKVTTEPNSIESLFDNLIINIQKNPIKKVIFLKLFLDRFHEITEQDKNVIIQSVKDEAPENIKEKLISLVKVFKLEI